MKKVISALLAVCMLAACSAGCSPNRKSQQSAVLTVELFDRSNAPANGGKADDNFTANWIKENFKKETGIDVKFSLIPRVQEVDKLNVLMASGDAPDIVFTYDQRVFLNYARQGGLADLSDAVEEYGPNLKEFLGDILKEGQFEGKQLAIPAKVAFDGLHCSWMRKDWLDALGLDVPTTREEWYEALKLIKEKDPGNVGKDKLVAFGLRPSSNTDMDNQFGANHLIWSFVTDVTDEEMKTLPYPLIPGWKEGVRFVNKLFNEGLIDSEFALDSTRYENNIVSGKTAFFTDNCTAIYGKQYLTALKANVKGADLVAVDPFENKDGKHIKPIQAQNGLYIMVPKTSKNVEAAVKYLDWMAKEETGKALNWGIEGEHYRLLEDGTTESLNEDRIALERWNVFDLAIMYNGFMPDNDLELYLKNLENTSYYKEHGSVITDSLKTAKVDGFVDYRRNPVLETVVEEETKYKATLDKIYLDGVLKAIMCKPEEFDATYDAMVEEYLKNGGQAVLDAKRAALK